MSIAWFVDFVLPPLAGGIAAAAMVTIIQRRKADRTERAPVGPLWVGVATAAGILVIQLVLR